MFSWRIEWDQWHEMGKACRLKMLTRSNLFTKICFTVISNVAVAIQEIASKIGPEFPRNDVFELK